MVIPFWVGTGVPVPIEEDTREAVRGRTWEHLLHVDLALLEEVGQPLPVLQLGRLLQAEQEEGEVGAVLQGVGQLRHAHQLRHDGPRRKLGQVRLHQGHVLLDLRTLVQDVEERLTEEERERKDGARQRENVSLIINSSL